MFYVKEKKDITALKFLDVKDKIFQVIMKKREQAYLKEYFETAKNNCRYQSTSIK